MSWAEPDDTNLTPQRSHRTWPPRSRLERTTNELDTHPKPIQSDVRIIGPLVWCPNHEVVMSPQLKRFSSENCIIHTSKHRVTFSGSLTKRLHHFNTPCLLS